MNELSVCKNRLKNVLVLDKKENPNKVVNVLKSDILQVLKNYMEISSKDINLKFDIDADGYYNLNLNASVRRLKAIGYFNENEM